MKVTVIGTGYVGLVTDPCLDVDPAKIKIFNDGGIPSKMLKAVEEVNEEQKLVLVDKVVAKYGEDLSGKTFAMWGLAFKPNTDDMREAPSRVIIGKLLKHGAQVQAYDPVAVEEARGVMGDWRLPELQLRRDGRAGGRARAGHSITEWKAFRTPDFDA